MPSSPPRPSPKGLPFLLLILPSMEPGQSWNMLYLLAVLVAQVPPSCWLNDVAQATVAAVEEGRGGEDGMRRAQHEGGGMARQLTHGLHVLHLPHVPLGHVAVERPGPADCCGGCEGWRR